MIRPGKDDKADDYFEIFYHGDNYLKSVIEMSLSDQKWKYKSHKFHTVIHACSDPNSKARTPHDAYILSSNLAQLRLWLLEITVKNYNEADHLNYIRQSEEYKFNSQLFKSSEVKFTYEHKPYYSSYSIDYEFRNEEFNSKGNINFISNELVDSEIRLIVKHICLDKKMNSTIA
jgi:hypothetical protein